MTTTKNLYLIAKDYVIESQTINDTIALDLSFELNITATGYGDSISIPLGELLLEASAIDITSMVENLQLYQQQYFLDPTYVVDGYSGTIYSFGSLDVVIPEASLQRINISDVFILETATIYKQNYLVDPTYLEEDYVGTLYTI